jgi:hypothetical protein
VCRAVGAHAHELAEVRARFAVAADREVRCGETVACIGIHGVPREHPFERRACTLEIAARAVRNTEVEKRIGVMRLIFEDALECAHRFIPAPRGGVGASEVQSSGGIAGGNGDHALEHLDGGGVVTLVEQCRTEAHAHRWGCAGERERFAQHTLGRGVVARHEIGEAEAFERGAAIRSCCDRALEQRNRGRYATFHEVRGAEQPQRIGVARRALENRFAQTCRSRDVSGREILMGLLELARDRG